MYYAPTLDRAAGTSEKKKQAFKLSCAVPSMSHGLFTSSPPLPLHVLSYHDSQECHEVWVGRARCVCESEKTARVCGLQKRVGRCRRIVERCGKVRLVADEEG